ncbi:MAG: ABC transporter [Verrucomicrobia bacterium]|nr:MAG: ABC transporter [Verrucomicrobiota bacterium]
MRHHRETLDSFQANRYVRAINLFLQALLIITLFAGINYLGMKYFERIDMTRNRVYSLSAESLSYLKQLQEPVRAIVTITEEEGDPDLARIYKDVRSVLREFAYATRGNPNGRIEVEFLNVYRQRRRAELLGVEEPNMVLFLAGEKRKAVFANDLYKTRDRRPSQFQGEKAFMAAILDVSSNQRPVLYFLTGHGEMRLADVSPLRGLSQIEAALRVRNYEMREFELITSRRVPEDAAMVFIISPQTALLPVEQEALRQYLSANAGRILIILDPAKSHGIEDLFFEWGILADDVLVVEADPNFRVEGGDLLVRRLAEHPATQVLVDNQIPVLSGPARSVRADPGRPLDESLTVTELMATSDASWGERGYFNQEGISFDAASDLRGPIKLGSIAERRVDSRLGISLPGGRLIVLGTSDLLSNNRIGAFGNLTLVLNTITWALGREDLLNIPSRTTEKLQLMISQEQLTYTRLGIQFGPPLFVALLGVLVLLRRRH